MAGTQHNPFVFFMQLDDFCDRDKTGIKLLLPLLITPALVRNFLLFWLFLSSFYCRSLPTTTNGGVSSGPQPHLGSTPTVPGLLHACCSIFYLSSSPRWLIFYAHSFRIIIILIPAILSLYSGCLRNLLSLHCYTDAGNHHLYFNLSTT